MQICTSCNTEKPLDYFYNSKRNKNGKIKTSKICHNKKTLEDLKLRKQKNPENFDRKNRDLRIQRDYGITLNQYEEMEKAQQGRCAICLEIPNYHGNNGKILCIDHNHVTGKVRALLCRNCNVAIGLLQDNRQILLRAADYLAEYD